MVDVQVSQDSDIEKLPLGKLLEVSYGKKTSKKKKKHNCSTEKLLSKGPPPKNKK